MNDIIAFSLDSIACVGPLPANSLVENVLHNRAQPCHIGYVSSCVVHCTVFNVTDVSPLTLKVYA